MASPRNPKRQWTRRLPLIAMIAVLVVSVVAPASAAPPKAPSFGAQIDPYPRYEAPLQCLNTAQPGVVAFRALLQDAYGANGGGILRACSGGSGTSDHHEGRAYDWMVDARKAGDRAKVDELLQWLLATDEHGNPHAMARRLGISYIIWDHQRWRAYRAHEGWTAYPGSNPHTDHVHFSFSWDGALQRTSFWSSGNSATPPRSSFPDVPRSSYYAEPVDWLVHHAITTGYGNTGEFRPHTVVTRAQMSAFLWRMMDEPKGFPGHGFPDVPSTSYYEDPVRWLRAHGYTQGVGDTGRFVPHRELTRGEMAEFIWRVAGRPAPARRHSFPDVSRDHYYDDAVSWMIQHGITTGYGNTGRFEPNLPVTRAQTAAFLHRFASTQPAWRDAQQVPKTVQFR